MDTLDELISERRIEPQLAMKILSHFDRTITETLQEKVKSRMSFKVCSFSSSRPSHDILIIFRDTLIPTASAMKSGPS